jgi:hypothetical protein
LLIDRRRLEIKHRTFIHHKLLHISKPGGGVQPQTQIIKMTSLKRSVDSDVFASNISNKTYVRSTRSGKVQKIVREVYLRTDIPCSSKLCKACLADAPRNAAQEGESPIAELPLACFLTLTFAQPSLSCCQRSQPGPRLSLRDTT